MAAVAEEPVKQPTAAVTEAHEPGTLLPPLTAAETRQLRQELRSLSGAHFSSVADRRRLSDMEAHIWVREHLHLALVAGRHGAQAPAAKTPEPKPWGKRVRPATPTDGTPVQPPPKRVVTEDDCARVLNLSDADIEAHTSNTLCGISKRPRRLTHHCASTGSTVSG